MSPPDDQEPTEEERRRSNLILLIVAVVVVVLGVYLVNWLVEQRKLQECLESGRRNCAPIETPAR
jgi:flagellar basal body-associated protein FliL